MEPLAFDLLHYLILNRSHVVSKEELVAEVWGGRIISDATLSSRIAGVRKAIGDDGSLQSLIRTVPRKGFRFTGVVKVITQVVESTSVSCQTKRASVDVFPGPGTQGPISLLVLPFSCRGRNPDQDYFSDAIVEDIIADLTRLEGCLVIAHGTSATFSSRMPAAREAGLELGVTYVIRGSVLRVNNDIHISVQLIETDTSKVVWAEKFNGFVENMYLLSEEVTLRVSRALSVNLVSAASRNPLRIQNPTAVDFTLRGRAILNGRITRENYAEARLLFSKALAIAPDLIDANALLGATDALDYGNFCTPPNESELLVSAEKHLSKALDLEPNHAWARYGLAFLYTIKRQPQAAREEALTAISLDRTLIPAYIRLGQIENFLGWPEEALCWVNRALQVSPREPRAGSAYFSAALSNALLGNDEEVIRFAKKSLSAGFKTCLPYTYLASSLAHVGRVPEAQEVLSQMQINYPNVSIASLYSNRRSDHPVYLTKWQRYFDGLRLAGLREE
jgi:TolB-like protein/tetratricopeptide (TPR) repeat protein